MPNLRSGLLSVDPLTKWTNIRDGLYTAAEAMASGTISEYEVDETHVIYRSLSEVLKALKDAEAMVKSLTPSQYPRTYRAVPRKAHW